MRLYTLAFSIGFLCLHVYGTSNAQITIAEKAISLPELFSEIKQQSGYSFFYNNAELRQIGKVQVTLRDASLEASLSQIFAALPLDYEIVNKTVVVKRKRAGSFAIAQNGGSSLDTMQIIDVSGTVTDTSGLALKGATVTLVGRNRSVSTHANGFFLLREISPGSTIRISFLGYQEKEIKVDEQSHITVVLLTKAQALDQVTVNAGILRRDRETFSGATTTFSGEELRRIGNQNIIQSLKALDPSFMVIENNALGSNPNVMPTIELRGKTSITTTQLNDRFALDPNQPLFVLNGFETTLEKIFNLDINRVASITILKDAASTAIYGSRAANGVIVVETLAPTPGKLRIQYTAGSNVNVPDLRSYNLMNAAEKLEFERLSGLYAPRYGQDYELEQLYNKRLAEVKRGVDSYWLAEPIQTGISNNHNLFFQGGGEDFTYGVQTTYRDERGVMKGSGRESWGGSIELTYRYEKINVSNQLYINGTNANESPYGSFSTFAHTNPYYRKDNPLGGIAVNLDTVQIADPFYQSFNYVPNPLYNATLNNVDKTTGHDIQNNLMVNWDIRSDLRINTALQLIKTSNTNTAFSPPEHTDFQTTSELLRGTYQSQTTETQGYDWALGVNYHRVLGKHSITADLRGRLYENTTNLLGVSATGFPYGTNGNPSHSFGYTPYDRPTSVNQTNRLTTILSQLNYGFDQRYFVDASYSLDGSSNFGSNRLFQPFWSLGAGWNIHQEAWLNAPWLTSLRVKANTGIGGNQALGQGTSTSTYQYITNANIFGQSLKLSSLGNPDLAWQTTFSNSFEASFGLWQGRLDGRINYFMRDTDPLLVNVSEVFPTSVGIQSAYPLNLGKLKTTGWEGWLSFVPVAKPHRGIRWTVSVNGAFGTRSEFGNFGHTLDALNDVQLNSNGLMRYHDGHSPDDLWAVISRGIDPATGKEIFLKTDGTETFVYHTEDIRKVGNTRPKLNGNISSSLTYGQFTLYVNAQYVLGAYLYNQTLYDKVEHISESQLAYNQDRRALYDRWQKVGDIAQFRGIQLTAGEAPPITTRFIQRDNHINFSSISLAWRADNKPWLDKSRINHFDLRLSLNDVFRMDRILYERGTNYPFQRTGTLTLNVYF